MSRVPVTFDVDRSLKWTKTAKIEDADGHQVCMTITVASGRDIHLAGPASIIREEHDGGASQLVILKIGDVCVNFWNGNLTSTHQNFRRRWCDQGTWSLWVGTARK